MLIANQWLGELRCLGLEIWKPSSMDMNMSGGMDTAMAGVVFEVIMREVEHLSLACVCRDA